MMKVRQPEKGLRIVITLDNGKKFSIIESRDGGLQVMSQDNKGITIGIINSTSVTVKTE